jgi:hypothetical protein
LSSHRERRIDFAESVTFAPFLAVVEHNGTKYAIFGNRRNGWRPFQSVKVGRTLRDQATERATVSSIGSDQIVS